MSKRSKFDGLFGEAVSDDVAEAAPPQEESKESRKQESKKHINQTSEHSSRVKTNLAIRRDHMRGLKLLAVDDGRKMYELLEEAIGDYLRKRGKSV